MRASRIVGSSNAGDMGATGESDDITAEWAILENLPCTTQARIYCFEQLP